MQTVITDQAGLGLLGVQVILLVLSHSGSVMILALFQVLLLISSHIL